MTNIMDLKNCSNDSEAVAELIRQLEDRHNTAMIPAVVMMVIFAVVGLAGNILVLVVYSKKMRTNPTKVLIMTIASFDLLPNVVVTPSEIATMMNTWRFSEPGLCKFKSFIIALTTIGGGMSLGVVAVVRYRKVCTPLGWQLTVRNAKCASLITALLAIICSIPYTIIVGIRTQDTPCPNIQRFECLNDDHYAETIWTFINDIFFITLYISLATTFAVLHVRIAVTAWKHREHHGVTSGTSKPKTKPNLKWGNKISAEDTTRKGACDVNSQSQHPCFIQESDQPSNRGAKAKLSFPKCCCRRQSSVATEQNSQCSAIMITYPSALSSDSCLKVTSAKAIKLDVNSPAGSNKSDGTSTGLPGVDTRTLGPSRLDERNHGASRLDERNHGASRLDERNHGASRLDERNHGASRLDERNHGASRLDERNHGASRLDERNHGASRLDERNHGASRLDERNHGASRLDERNHGASRLDERNHGASRLDERNHGASRLDERNHGASRLDERNHGASRLDERNHGASRLDERNHGASRLDERNHGASRLDERNHGASRLDERNHGASRLDERNHGASRLDERNHGASRLDETSIDVSQSKTRNPEETHLDVARREGTTNSNQAKNSETDNSFNKKDSTSGKSHSEKKWKSGTEKIRPRTIGRKTNMLIAISLIFILSYIPYLILATFRNQLPDKHANFNNVELVLYNLFTRLYFLNTAANPIIYSWCDINFRLKSMKLLTCKCRRL